jgi:hypothetical protein
VLDNGAEQDEAVVALRPLGEVDDARRAAAEQGLDPVPREQGPDSRVVPHLDSHASSLSADFRER